MLHEFLGHQEIQLLIRLSNQDGQIVQGVIVTCTQEHLQQQAQTWRQYLSDRDNDYRWDWEKKDRLYTQRSPLPGESYALTVGDSLEGLLIITLRGYRSIEDPDQRLVFVQNVAAAPWNRFPARNLFPIGRRLLEVVALRSYELGYSGYVGLESFENSARFYSRIGMTNYGYDPDSEMIYFEKKFTRPTLNESA